MVFYFDFRALFSICTFRKGGSTATTLGEWPDPVLHTVWQLSTRFVYLCIVFVSFYLQTNLQQNN